VNLRIDAEGDTTHAEKVILQANLDVMLLCSSAWNTLFFVRILHNSGIPLVYSERSAPRSVSHLYWNPLEHSACLLAMDHIVLIQEGFRREFPEYLQDRISVIPNMKSLPKAKAKPEGEPGKQKVLLSVGRCIEAEKQLSMLFTAFAGLKDYFPDWKLRHCGIGQDFDAYKQLIKALDCEKQIELAGVVNDMDAEYLAAQLLCLPSKFEGCSNVLLEAHACGLPTVGFADAPGVNEQIIHEKNGLLIKDMDAEALAEALAALMAAPLKRREMGLQARLGAAGFTPDVIADRWESLLLRTAELKGRTRLNIPLPEDEAARKKLQAEAALRGILLRRHPLKAFSM
jgi:glycosyltransferase involved in cell wall biosynthesis